MIAGRDGFSALRSLSPPAFAGREFGGEVLGDLPPGVDPCRDNGEFHTFCHAGPVFDRTIPVRVGEASALLWCEASFEEHAELLRGDQEDTVFSRLFAAVC